ncbi:MAG TPA: 4'-phosphopantetheinyl transferase superfamily protein [Sphingobacteriaceae bacterium]|nr:4'-phosphopantetheinyl transferase superfamily protein [Sphingobacteriaceae bacterium]
MGLVHRKQIDEKTSFAIWKIEETADELYSQLQLDCQEKEYLETLNTGKRDLHWLGTRVLLRKMLNTDRYIDMEVDEHGKPHVKNFPHHISLSHSYDYAAVMISEDKPVGIDIEIVKDKIERVAKKFLCQAEMDFIDKTNKVEQLYICWCAKEAIYKLQGKRNVSFLNDIRLYPFECCEGGSIGAKLFVEGAEKSFVVYYEKYENYMLGYVVDRVQV